MPITVVLGPGRLIPPVIEPPDPTGELYWVNTGSIIIQQNGNYDLKNDLFNGTGDPAMFGYEGPDGYLAAQGVTLNQDSGVLTAAQNAVVGTTLGHGFAAVTPMHPVITDAWQGVVQSQADGMTSNYVNYAHRWHWRNFGGDWLDADGVPQGGNNYGTLSHPMANSTGTRREYTGFPVALIQRIKQLEAIHGLNTFGIHLRALSGNQQFVHRGHPAGGSNIHWFQPPPYPNVVSSLAPILRVTVGGTTIDCMCTCSSFLNPNDTSGSPPDTGESDYQGSGTYPDGTVKPQVMGLPCVLQFDLSGITGTPTAATLSMCDYRGTQQPTQVAINLCDPNPYVLRPSIEWWDRVRADGLASLGANDSALAAHPRVMVYTDLNHRSDAQLRTEWWINEPIAAGDENDLHGNPNKPHTYEDSFAHWGLTALRGHNVYPPVIGGNHRIMEWFCTPPRFLRQPPVPPPRTMFYRYLFRMQPNMPALTCQQGVKLSGNSSQNAITGEWTGYDFPFYGYITHHVGGSHTNPFVYAADNYVYDMETTSGNTGVGMFIIEPGVTYCIEQEYTSNDLPDVRNGIHRVWVDGVLVWEKTNCWMRRIQEPILLAIPTILVFQGGEGPQAHWLNHAWYEVGGMCFALDYIGPPKRIS